MEFGIKILSQWMGHYLPLVGVIVVWCLFYLIFDFLMVKLVKKQKEKKKRVFSRLDQIKLPYRQKEEVKQATEKQYSGIINYFSKWDELIPNKEKWGRFKEAVATLYTENKMVEALRFEKHLSQEEIINLQKESVQISKEEKHLPFLNMVNFIVRIAVFIEILHYYLKVDEVHLSNTLIYSTVILSFFSTVTRKTAVIFLILAVLGYFIYLHFTGAACLFILIYWTMKGIQFRIKQIRKMIKNKKTE